MTLAAHWLKRVMFRNALVAISCAMLGMFIAWVWINLSAGPGTVVTSQEEAEGPQFSDPSTLDVVVKFHRDRVCPSVTQRWVWRWTMYQGKRVQQALPLAATATPFLADGNEVMLTLPNPGVPDLGDQWFYRTVTTESCGFLPSWASAAFGGRIYRSPDQPVNFVGAPHR